MSVPELKVEGLDNEQVADQKLAELREKARGQYSDKEIDDFINMGKKIAAKSVLYALMEIIKEGPAKGFNQKESDELVEELVSAVPYNSSAFITMEFEEINFKLNVCLSLVEKTYKSEIDLPSYDYVNDLFEKYDFLKNTAIAYWHTFMENNNNLMARIESYRPDVDFSKLNVDPLTKTTLYWDPECAKRIGIFNYYVDPRGNPFYKKTTGGAAEHPQRKQKKKGKK
jgi:hypothetical protein